MRIVSLIASATEIIWELGFGPRMVGRSHECDYPREVLELPCVTWTKFRADGRSYEIDERVKAIAREGLSVYGVDTALLDRLAPDVIVTQDHCQVCAVSLADVEAAVCQIVSSRPRIVSLHPDSLADIWRDIRAVAAALGDPERGEAAVTALEARMSAISRRIADAATRRPSVVFVEWIEPLMAGGNWAPELIEMAGGNELIGVAGAHSPQLPFSALMRADPEVIIIAPCGFDLERTRMELPALTSRPEWPRLRAVREGRVYLADGNQYFNRPGPRVAETLEICAEILHPGLFPPRHAGNAWQPL
jgi:iron complex transport system substrate-binding protein